MDLAQVVIVGTLEIDPKEIKYAKNTLYTPVPIKVYRPFKDVDGRYVSDTYEVYLWKGASTDLVYAGYKNCKVCICGRLETVTDITGLENKPKIIAEKLSFS